MLTPLPSNFTIIDGADTTISAMSEAANTLFLKAYYLVLKKEDVSATKDIVAIRADGGLLRGAEARNFLGISTTAKATISPTTMPEGSQAFVQSTSHNRKIPSGSKVLLMTAADCATNNAPPPAPAAAAPTAGNEDDDDDDDDDDEDNNPRPNKQPRIVPPAGPVDASDPLGSEVLQLRLNREGARSCEALQASLIWNDIADLDLSCVTPDGTTIYYGNKESVCGGWLDVDMNVSKSTASTQPVENIFWASAPSGKYQFRVTNFNCHTDPENTVFVDPGRAVPFRLFLTKNGEREVFDGEVKHKEMKVCVEFELEGDGAVGSFVVLPPNKEKKSTFRELCEAHGVTYNAGQGLYALARPEDISKDKHLVLQNIEKDTFTIGATEVRTKLGWPVGTKIRKKPSDIPENHRLFVQSTSHNRLIPPNTHTLMQVPMREALAFRPAYNTRFSNETHTMGQGGATAAE